MRGTDYYLILAIGSCSASAATNPVSVASARDECENVAAGLRSIGFGS